MKIRINPAQNNTLLGLVFCSPLIVGLVCFTLYPIISSFYYSLCNYPIFSQPEYIGLQNYRDMLNDRLFWISIKNTAYFTIVGVPLGLILALALALLLNAKVRGQSFFRTIFFLPTMVPFVASSVLWLWLLNPQYGIFNEILSWFGVDPVGWLVDPQWSKPSLIIMGLWGVGGSMVIFLAALQDVPQALYEAAEIDGAGYAWRLWHIVIPTISPIIMYLSLVGIIGSLQYFTQPLIMTGGGPVNSTLVYALNLFIEAFLNFRMGYASALAWVLFVISVAVSLLIMRASRRMVHYGEEQ